MQALGRGQRSYISHPALSVFMPINGVLEDVDVVEYVIVDRTGDVPTQVPHRDPAASPAEREDRFPASGGGHLVAGAVPCR